MSRRDMPRCSDERPYCFARTKEGKCFCLQSTLFEDNICPFYKTEKDVKYFVTAREYKDAKNSSCPDLIGGLT